MSAAILPSDVAILDLLRQQDEMSIAQLIESVGVTATAVRQRLVRLLDQQLIERNTVPSPRGRPRHVYRLTTKGLRRSGENFADLAIALWQEIRSIEDLEVRRGLMARISRRLATMYADKVNGDTLTQRMQSVKELFDERHLQLQVDDSGQLPVISVGACPYPDLAEQDREVCSMEGLLFSEMLGVPMELTSCRLDGDCGCTYEPRVAIASGSQSQ
jgi:DeoR family suf operon transcriptional repressor